ncbi:MAG: ABC transporter permease [Bacillota bacterium]|jgi:ABC-type transport system involved in multi-copper enzyme maturation permease subunit
MQPVLSVARTELKQQLRSPIFWILVLFSLVLAYDGYYTSPNLWENLHWAGDTLNLAVLLLALLAIMSAGREQRQRVGEIINSSQAHNWQLILGHWLGLALIAAGLSCILVLIATVRALLQGGTLQLTTLLLFWLAFYLPNLLLGITVGLTIGSFIPTLFVSFPLVIGWWFLLSNASTTGALARALPWVLADILDFTASSPLIAGASFGFFPWHRLLLNRGAQLGLMVALLSILSIFHKRHRDSRLRWQKVLPLLLSVLMLAGTTLAFAQELRTAQVSMLSRWGYTELGQSGVQAERERWRALADANPTAIAQSYQMELRFLPTARRLEAQVKVMVQNTLQTPLEQLIFTLDSKMRIDQAAWQGQPVEVQESEVFGWRQIELPQVLAGGASGELSLYYSGEVWEWVTRWNGRDPELVAFISEQGVFLPPHLCWYPVPGMQDVLPSTGLQAQLSSYPVDFSVTLKDSAQPAFTNLVHQEDDTWTGRLPGLLVVAGNWRLTKTENVSLLRSPDRALDDYSQGLQDIYQLASRYLGTLPTEQITVITVPNWFYGQANSQATQVALIGERRLSFDPRPNQQLWQRQSMLQRVLGCWYDTNYHVGAANSLSEDGSQEVRLALTSYLWSLYREGLPGQRGSLQQEYEVRQTMHDNDLIPTLDTGQLYSVCSTESNALWLDLEELRRSAGEQALQERLRQLLVTARVQTKAAIKLLR